MAQRSLDRLIEKISQVLEPRDEILEAYLYGSRARGHQGPLARVGVAVYVDTNAPGSYPYGYAADLITSLMRKLAENSVDVVVLNQAPPLLYHRVLRDGVRILSRSLRDTVTREGQALSRYCDFAPQLKKIAEAQNARIASGQFGR